MTQEAIGSIDPIMERLEQQITWYDTKSIYNKKAYKLIKVVEIIAAALIPLIASLNLPYHTNVITGALGVLITVLEGLIHLNQYPQNWTAYRSTCEALRHEKYVYLAKAAPYAGVADSYALLAERIESLVSQEHAKWASVQTQENK
ncbi:MAG TPA: DUF4231 domain-containing protein [Edaphobacter sp.]|jgi:hypothetical protein|nr:DUF4231 domain-containing protein [Edaphobacter sp.]